jgi:tRNA G10  N-methylase Trm11
MCGIGTTLVEAIHLGRDAIGIDLEPRWAALAAANISHARRHGATGTATVVTGDARDLSRLLDSSLAERVALVLTSPPYGRSLHGQVTARPGRGVAKFDHTYSTDPTNLGRVNPSAHLAETAGLVLYERNAALLVGLREDRLVPRPSFFQLDRVRKARARGLPIRIIAHEDVLVFRQPATPVGSR